MKFNINDVVYIPAKVVRITINENDEKKYALQTAYSGKRKIHVDENKLVKDFIKLQ